MKQSPDSHMALGEIQSHTEKWEQEPVSALNVWFTLMPSWSKVISSMLRFLIGELPSMPIKAPMVEHQVAGKTWSWIGKCHRVCLFRTYCIRISITRQSVQFRQFTDLDPVFDDPACAVDT